MEALAAILKSALGLTAQSLTIPQMILRGLVIYMAMVMLVRIGKKRFMGAATAFDVILGFMIGSIASRAVTGNAPFAPALAATATLFALHWLFSRLAMHSNVFGSLIKGHVDVVIEDGKVDEAALREAHLSERDLSAALRKRGVSSLDEVVEATRAQRRDQRHSGSPQAGSARDHGIGGCTDRACGTAVRQERAGSDERPGSGFRVPQ